MHCEGCENKIKKNIRFVQGTKKIETSVPNQTVTIVYDGSKYPAYFQLQAQITREFRHFSIYLGGENLTNYKISDPIKHAHNPWSSAFDATQIWGPVTGAMAYIGIRIKIEKL